MSRSLADALGKLLGAGGKLAASQLTMAQRRALEEFACRTQAVRLAVSGRGSLYQIAAPEQVEVHLSKLRPAHSGRPAGEIPLRALNVVRNRDSKSGAARHAVQYLLLKAVNGGQYWRDGKGVVLDVSQLTQTCGAAALAVKIDDDWHTAAPLWLIENQALFDDISWLPAGSSGTVCYYSGQLSGLLLTWLAERPRASQVILFPDYDGIGLQNFARLYELMGDACKFWLMPDWQVRLSLYGNQQIWQDSLANYQDAVRRLRALGMPSELAELCDALQGTGLALEQESVFLLPGKSQYLVNKDQSDNLELIEIARGRSDEAAIPFNPDNL
ncbi:hypothetical protein [Pseudomonas aestiva]|uniref:DUF7281 domain-containing protein n=1 Tax=Pseudomonas aestiva TaxID=3136739 RepID=UPI0032651BE7